MNTKIRIKLGAIEVEYEGSEAFLKEELPQLLAAVAELHSKSKFVADTTTPPEENRVQTPDSPIEATTGTIAAKFAVKQGPDLILAAAARLTFALGKPTFSRQQLTDEMKSATAYYKQSYMNNLSKYLNRLMKDGKLLEPATGTYSLSATTQTDLRTRLA